MEKTKGTSGTTVLLAVVLIGLILVVSGVIVIQNPFGADEIERVPGVVPVDTEYSVFKFTAVEEDKTSTTVSGATVRAWYDGNADGKMQYSELGSFTEASSVYTTDMEYPIGTEFTIHVQVYKSTHQITYAQVHMSGQRNSDGSAKTIGQIELRTTDDSMTYSGMANGAAFDTTDYNYTLTGTSGTLETEIILSAADKGISSQVWDFDYEKAYGVYKSQPFHVKWDEIGHGTGDTILVDKDSVLAATFIAFYCTNQIEFLYLGVLQDKVDLQIDVTDFDINYNDGVMNFTIRKVHANWYFIEFLDSGFGDLMYNTVDGAAPRPSFSFEFGSATSGGTFASTYGVSLWQNVKFAEMTSGAWTKGTDLALGTSGDNWSWVA